MTDAPALLIAGVGLSFLGLEILTNALQESTSRTVRALIKRSTRTTPACAAVGLATGALVQSTTAIVTVLGSMTSAGMTTLRQAITIVAFANLGTTALVFAGAFDMHIAVLLALGISGIAFSLSRRLHWKAIASVTLGVALLLYGSNLMSGAASDVQGAGWFASFLRGWHASAVMAFSLGCLASFLTQSTTAVALMTIAIANAGLVDGEPAVAMIFGANLGSTFMRLLLTRKAAGAPRQVTHFQNLFKGVGTGLCLLLFAIERGFHVPGVYAAIRQLPVSFPIALAIAHVSINGATAVIAALFAEPIARFVQTTWPSDLREDLAAPVYAIPEAVADAATATDLLEKEQMRILTATREYMAIARAATGATHSAGQLHRRFGRLFHEIDHFCVALVSKQIDETTSARLGNVQGRQKVLELLEDSLHQLSAALVARPRGRPTLEPFLENVVETLDFLLLIGCEAAGTLDQDRAALLVELSGDRSEMMAGVRNLYLAPDQSLSAPERALLLRLTALFERIVWMVQRYAELLLRSIDPQPQAAVQAGAAPAEETGKAAPAS